jgi:hypothetical protein
VTAHGPLADAQVPGDGPVRHAGHHEAQHLVQLRREPGRFAANGHRLLPQQLEVAAQRRDDHRSADEERTFHAGAAQWQQRRPLVDHDHLHRQVRDHPAVPAGIKGRLQHLVRAGDLQDGTAVDVAEPNTPLDQLGGQRPDGLGIRGPREVLGLQARHVALCRQGQLDREGADLVPVGQDPYEVGDVVGYLV